MLFAFSTLLRFSLINYVSALLVAALATGNREVFPECFQDRMHQPYRLPLIPGMETILKLRAPGLLGCTLSGAGPAMLVLYDEGSESVVEMVRDQFTEVVLVKN